MTAATPLRPAAPHPALGGPVLHLAQTTSTNDRAIELARGGAADGTLVVAEEQTAGRGRQGRRWVAPPGRALTLSVIHRQAEQERRPEAVGMLALASGLAVCDACEALAPVTCMLKWPNDVWIGGRKVAGILIEARPQEGWAVLGIGLNVDVRQEGLGVGLQAATSLRIETGAPVARDAALEALCAGLGNRLDQLRKGDLAALRRAFAERDALFERSIRWTLTPSTRGGERAASGSARGIDESGRLVVLTEGGERIALEAGEVHLEPSAGALDEL